MLPSAAVARQGGCQADLADQATAKENAKQWPEAVSLWEQVTKAKNDAETTAILAALESTHWNRKKAAAMLKIDYKALLYKMKKLGIEDRMASLPKMADSAKSATQGD